MYDPNTEETEVGKRVAAPHTGGAQVELAKC